MSTGALFSAGKVKRAGLDLVDSLSSADPELELSIDKAQVERLKRLIRNCGRKVASRQRRFGSWKWTNYWMSVVGAVLAAVAGATALGKLVPNADDPNAAWWLRNLPGLLAIAAAVVTAIGTGLDPAGRTVRIGIERGSWGILQSDVLAFTSEAARRRKARAESAAQFVTWFGSHLDDLERRFARQEAEDAAARKPPGA
jgi:hypothetical protein